MRPWVTSMARFRALSSSCTRGLCKYPCRALMSMGNYSQSLNIIQQVLKTHPTDEDALEVASLLQC
jgi:hypothetical protein